VTALFILAAFAVGLAAGYALGRVRHRAGDTAPLAAPVAAPVETRPASGTDADTQRMAEELAAARAEATRYRQLVIDIENNAPPPLMGPGAPDDLKLIVGVGPVLERMLHQLGVTTFRQVAYWSENDIDVIDAKLHEFPGRIRRDGWVIQARALHQSKYGEALPSRPEASR
jgi:predicted flap endonuclease-1-like 5' DNA nuclease